MPPPPPAERLLHAVLGPGEVTDTILGDLHEEYAVLARTRTRRRADAWYWSQAIRLAVRYGARAATRRIARPDLPVQPEPAGDSLMRTLGLETRHALRALIKRPALSLIVIGTLSLGLGANAAVLAMIDALVIRPFVFSDIDRIALVSQTSREYPADRRGRVAPANFIDWKKQTDVFERLAAFEWWDVDLIGRDVPERVQGFFVSADFFPALGVRPDRGRSFLPEEETVGRHRVVVL